MSYSKISVLLLMTLLLLVGCSGEDNPAVPGETGNSLTAMLRGRISPEPIDFEMTAKVGDGMGDPATLIVRGRNLEYDSDMGALKIDLSVYNDSDMELPQPVSLTFMQFMPEEVTVLNPDNEESGPGAMVGFTFADDDLVWSPGEESESRSVHFGVASGTSFGFVGRIDLGMDPMGGTIGGLVWNDEDEDGEIGDGEMGVGGVSLALYAGDDAAAEPVATAETDEEGTYRFPGQEAGYYTVVREDMEGLTGTTPAAMAVVLVELDGTVSDFLIANFGVMKGSGGELASISGVVWDDLNGDGVMDEGEAGLRGIRVGLQGAAIMEATTDADGAYMFAELSMGDYTVKSFGPDGWTATTDEVVSVTIDTAGQAEIVDFGWMEDSGDDFVRVGDYVEARGDYMEEPDRLASDRFKVKRCDGTKHDRDDDDDDCDDDCDDDDCDDDGDCRQNACWGRLNGPITGHSMVEGYVEVMGTKVYWHDKTGGGWDWEFRVRLDVRLDDDGEVVACKAPKKAKKYDEVRGFVQEVVKGEDGMITGVMVLNTLVEVPEDYDEDE